LVNLGETISSRENVIPRTPNKSVKISTVCIAISQTISIAFSFSADSTGSIQSKLT
jgi:hypothetical protein